MSAGGFGVLATCSFQVLVLQAACAEGERSGSVLGRWRLLMPGWYEADCRQDRRALLLPMPTGSPPNWLTHPFLPPQTLQALWGASPGWR